MKEKFLFTRAKRRLLQHTQITRAAIFILVSLFLFSAFTYAGPIVSKISTQVSLGYHTIRTFVMGPKALKNSQGVTSVLILGMGGVGHEASDLTDSMILFSYNQITRKATVVSLPRDLWIPDLRAKINTAFHYGELKKTGGGSVLVKSIVEEVTGQGVHYIAIVDFTAFRETIDILEGVVVCVENAFDDYNYPIPGMENAEPESLRYEHLHFDSGCQTLNGEQALKFARSRYADGSEGTDFSRSKRQEKIILAIKNKLSSSSLFDLKKVFAIKNTIMKNITSDISQDDYPAFARLGLSFNPNNITTGVLDLDDPNTGHSGLLANPPISSKFDQQWVLIPKAGSGNWTDIRNYISSLITSPPN